MAELRIEGLVKRFGDTVAVDGVSLTVADGEVLVLLGPSGCGKSTLLRLVAGLEQPDRGRVLLDGDDVTPLRPARRDVAMVFQSYALYPHMTVADNVGVHLRLTGVAKDEIRRRVAETAELLDVGDLLDRKPRQLSGGQRQRVALARAIIRQPRLFLLDEPLSNLDALLRERTRRELRLLFDRLGVTVLHVTHDQSEALTLGDRVAVLRRGRVEQVGTPAEVYRRPATTFVAGFVGSPPMNLLPAAWWVEAGLVETVPEGAATVGIRPERVRVEPVEARRDGPDRGGGVPARVLLAESPGPRRVLTLEVAGERLQAVVEGEGEGADGAMVSLAVRPEDLHPFDREGDRLPE